MYHRGKNRKRGTEGLSSPSGDRVSQWECLPGNEENCFPAATSSPLLCRKFKKRRQFKPSPKKLMKQELSSNFEKCESDDSKNDSSLLINDDSFISHLNFEKLDQLSAPVDQSSIAPAAPLSPQLFEEPSPVKPCESQGSTLLTQASLGSTLSSQPVVTRIQKSFRIEEGQLKDEGERRKEEMVAALEECAHSAHQSFNLGPFFGLNSCVLELLKIHRGITKLYEWQEDCIIKGGTGSNLLISMPTSGGKTLVAEVLVWQQLLLKNRDALFILPYVALVQEKVRDLSPFGVELDFLVEEYASSRGTYPPARHKKKRVVYVATIEKALGLVNSLMSEDRMKELGLVVVDEVHMVGEGGGRGATLENLLTTLRYTAPCVQMLAMSATVGNINELAEFLGAETYENNFRPVQLIEYVMRALLLTLEGWETAFQWVPSHAGIPGNEVADSAARMTLTDLNTTPFPLPLSAAKRLISRVCRSNWNNTLGDTLCITSMGQYRSDYPPAAAKECVGERPRSRRGFVSTETLEKIEESRAARLAGNRDQHRALSRRTRTLLGRDKERYMEQQLCQINKTAKTEADLFINNRTCTFNSRDHIGVLVEELVPEHSCLVFCPTKLGPCPAFTADTVVLAGLTDAERHLLEEAYLQGTICIICCTSTLAAGINLPARRVIIRSPYTGRAFLTRARYKQMSGRAGRAGLSSCGESYLIIDRRDLNQVGKMLVSAVENCVSTLAEGEYHGLTTLLFNAIGLGVAVSLPELRALANHSLLALQASDLNVDVSAMALFVTYLHCVADRGPLSVSGIAKGEHGHEVIGVPDLRVSGGFVAASSRLFPPPFSFLMLCCYITRDTCASSKLISKKSSEASSPPILETLNQPVEDKDTLTVSRLGRAAIKGKCTAPMRSVVATMESCDGSMNL
ncbi:Helicase POLQ-like [Chionoecetes opilio]|uniref:Helicase POLQ-like n=1 Tax=Chionoecetes opilio TaxID=41210 RepID=A0A8J4YFX2_CHIOP|nr:Helicase POLQ-like [Chionoecetes opilio]